MNSYKFLRSKLPGVALASVILFVLALVSIRRCVMSTQSTFRTQNLLVDDTAIISGLTTVAGGITGLPAQTCSAGHAVTAVSTTGTTTCGVVGTVTSVTCGTDLNCTPTNPFTVTGTVALDVPGTAGQIPKSDGAGGQVVSGITDSGSIISTQEKVQVGISVPPSNQGILLTPQSAIMTTQVFVEETDLLHTAVEAINVVGAQDATFDTTAAPASGNAITGLADSSRAAGANPLTNSAFLACAQNGDVNYTFIAASGCGSLRNDDGAVLGPTTATALTGITGAFDASASTSAALGANVLPFRMPGSSVLNPQIGLGAGGTTSTQIETKNTIPADVFAGLTIYADTTVNAAAEGVININRGAGGGGTGSPAGSLVVSSGAFGYGSIANDFVISDEFPSKHIIFSADASGFTAGLILDSLNVTTFPNIAHIKTTGTAATLSCNGSVTSATCSSASCNDISGTVLSNTGATTCTITFMGQTYVTAPTCTVGAGVAGGGFVSARSATAITITFASLTNGLVDYICTGH